jgi:hypothetical protein
MQTYPEVDYITAQDKEIFFSEYVHKNPVVIKGFYLDSTASKKWDADYLISACGNTPVKIHYGPTSQNQKKVMLVEEYIKLIHNNDLQEENVTDDNNQLYLYNFQLIKLGEKLLKDLDVNPGHLIGDWYYKNWRRDLFFFYGNRHTRSRLHYDSLGTHNTFFQISGKKKFILIPYHQIDKCYINYPKNTFSNVNPEHPDLNIYPLFKDAKPRQAILEGGDVLYMPPYTLHHVMGININISMNIDWHTPRSVIEAFTLGRVNGLICHYWNFISFLGVSCRIPNSILYPLYKSQYR